MIPSLFRLIGPVHRLLASHVFYPLALSSGLSLAIYTGRVFFSESWQVYFNLVYNLALAWVPYSFSLLISWLHQKFPRRWWLLLPPTGLWLLFFPNAPYLVTDFLHLAPRPGIPMWYDILMLASFSWTGIFLAIVSLFAMQRLVKAHLGRFLSWAFVALALGLGGLGIYLGRFERWNSWDVLFHPTSIFKDIALRVINPLDNLRFMGFTILVTAFLVVCYLTFTAMQGIKET